MPTNVPPQYREAEQRFREARSPQAKVAILQEMLSIVPKHKGTDHLRAQLRARMSKLMDELARSVQGAQDGTCRPVLAPEGGWRQGNARGPRQRRQDVAACEGDGRRP